MRLTSASNGKDEFLIRCEAQRYSVTIDAELEIFDSSPPELVYREFKIIKRTPKGAWIDPLDWRYPELGRFVLLSARKQYASETREEALDQFRHRKLSQVRILNGKLRCAKEDLELAKRTQAEAKSEAIAELGSWHSETWKESNNDRGV